MTYHITDTALAFQITSITISSISIIYGLSRCTLRNILGRDPKVTENLFYAFTELSTSLTILISPLIYVLSADSFFLFSHNDYITIIVYICIFLLMVLPLSVSYCVLSPRVGFQLCMMIDYRIYFSFVCKHKSNMTDLVRARRNILIVSVLYSLFATLICYAAGLNDGYPFTIIPI